MLPMNEQIALCRMLHRSIRKESKSLKVTLCSEKATRYVNAMNDIIGRNILGSDRDNILVWGRNWVIWQMVKDGMTEQQVAYIIGKDHSTIHYTKERIRDVMDSPSLYEYEINLWNKFQQAIL